MTVGDPIFRDDFALAVNEAELNVRQSILVEDFPPSAAEQGEPCVSTFDAQEESALVATDGWPVSRTWVPLDFAHWFATSGR